MEREINVSYVINVIEPLEKVIQQIQACNEVSLEALKELDGLLLEKYLMIERILENSR